VYLTYVIQFCSAGSKSLAAFTASRERFGENGNGPAAPEARAAESRRHPHGSNQIQSEKGEAQTRKLKKGKENHIPTEKRRTSSTNPTGGCHAALRVTRQPPYPWALLRDRYRRGGKPTSGAGQHPTCTITRRRGPGASINFTRALLGSRHLCAPLSPPRLPWPSSPRAPPGGRGNPVPILFLRARLRLGGGSKAPRAFWLRTPAISDSDSP
jgi:hypothetical protein